MKSDSTMNYLLRVASEEFKYPEEHILHPNGDYRVQICRGCIARTLIRSGRRYADVAELLDTTMEGVTKALQAVNLIMLGDSTPDRKTCRRFLKRASDGLRGTEW